MSIPVLPSSSKDKNLTARERVLRAELPDASLMPRLKPWLLAGLALLIGIGIGVLTMRHRHAAEQNVAAVNGVPITQSQLFHRLELFAGPVTLHQMAQEQLQLQFAAKKGAAPTDAEVNKEFQKLSRVPKFARDLAANGLTETDYKDSLRVKLAQADVLIQGVNVSDAEVRAYYAAQTDPRNLHALYYQPDSIIVRTIGIDSRATMAKAMQELAVHTPFPLVASQYSQDTASKQNGGLLSPLQRGRSPLTRTPAVEQAVFNLKIGEQLGPIAFHNGWWLFLCEDKKLGKTQPFAEVKDDCILGTKIAKGTKMKGKAINTEFQDFQRKSVLQAFWKKYQPVMTAH